MDLPFPLENEDGTVRVLTPAEMAESPFACLRLDGRDSWHADTDARVDRLIAAARRDRETLLLRLLPLVPVA